MALPIWGIYMKNCYADEELNVSKDEFEAPEALSIRVDCSEAATSDNPIIDDMDAGMDDLF